MQMLSDPRDFEYIDGIAVHWDDDSYFAVTNPLDQINRQYPSKFILYSRAANGDSINEYDFVGLLQ